MMKNVSKHPRPSRRTLLASIVALIMAATSVADNRSEEVRQAFGNQVDGLFASLEPLTKSGLQVRPAGGKEFADKNDYLLYGSSFEFKVSGSDSTEDYKFTFYLYDDETTCDLGAKSLVKKLDAPVEPSKTFPLNERLEESGELELGTNSYYRGKRSSTKKESKYPVYSHVAIAQTGLWMVQIDVTTSDADKSEEIRLQEVAILELMIEAIKNLE